MKIVLIGAGNVATHLGKALKQAGHDIVCVYSRTDASARTLSDVIGCSYATSIESIDNNADIYISALKDSVFYDLLPCIVKGRSKALFIHTAGSLPMDAWKGTAERYGVLYPMQTFSKKRNVDFKKVPLFIEANNEKNLEVLRRIANDVSEKVYEADSEKRRFLHLAAVFACNFSNHMYALCNEILSEHGIPFDIMLPLIDETAAKVHELSPRQAQTGPAVRYDENVIDRHLSMMEDEDMRNIYLYVSKSINKLSGK